MYCNFCCNFCCNVCCNVCCNFCCNLCYKLQLQLLFSIINKYLLDLSGSFRDVLCTTTIVVVIARSSEPCKACSLVGRGGISFKPGRGARGYARQRACSQRWICQKIEPQCAWAVRGFSQTTP